MNITLGIVSFAMIGCAIWQEDRRKWQESRGWVLGFIGGLVEPQEFGLVALQLVKIDVIMGINNDVPCIGLSCEWWHVLQLDGGGEWWSLRW